MDSARSWAEEVAGTSFTAARQVTDDGTRRYLVWTRRGGATAVHSYEADSAEQAKTMAREVLAVFEAAMNKLFMDIP